MGHLKDLEISKYKRESKGRWLIKICHFIFVIVVLFGFLNIKSVKIYAIPYIFATALLLYKLDTLLLKQKKRPVLDITGFFFYIHTQVTTLVLCTSAFTWVLLRKKKPVIFNTDRFFCFNRTVSYTCIVYGTIKHMIMCTMSLLKNIQQQIQKHMIYKVDKNSIVQYYLHKNLSKGYHQIYNIVLHPSIPSTINHS